MEGEVRLPNSANRGMRFAAKGLGGETHMLRTPYPNSGSSMHAGQVELDGMHVPLAVACDDPAATCLFERRNPARLEKDSLLVIPEYRYALMASCIGLRDPARQTT